MANNKFIYDYCKEKHEANNSWESIIRLLVKEKHISKDATIENVRSIYRDIAGHVAAGEIIQDDGSRYDLAFDHFSQFIGKTSDKFIAKKKSPTTPKDVILCIGDTHIPYFEEEKLFGVLKTWQGKANKVVICGDFLNGERLSSHAKFKHESFKEELAKGRTVLEYISSLYDEVYLLDDNHVDARWKRFLGLDVQPDLHFLMTHPYDFLCKGLTNVIRAKDTFNKYGEDIGHCLVLGDALFSHGFVSGKDGGSARKVEQWYSKWAPLLELPPVRVTVHAHSHGLGINYGYDSAVIQNGCFASMEGLKYSLEGQLKSSPPCYGYSVVTQYNGKTDFSETNVYKL